jgi:glycerol uptake facilitator protein
VLLWGILGAGDAKNNAVGANLGGLLVGFVVVAVGLSLGGPSGYSINPARDLGPRILGAIVGTQGLFSGIYWLLPPVIVPVIGGVLGCLSYDWLVTPFLAEE